MSSSTPDVSNAEMPESRQAAMKNRIITHMNADHTATLELYLRHFCSVTASKASGARMTDITTEEMEVESKAAGRHAIPFEPPMRSFAEARERVVEMHHRALRGLGLSDTKVDTFVGPNRAWQVLTVPAVLLTVATFPVPSKLDPASGSLPARVWSVGGLVPALGSLAYTLSPVVLPFILVIHTVEAENFSRTRLRKHQVPVGGLVWCLWMVYAFVGGIACFTRFDDHVRRIELEKQKNEKH